MRKNLRSMQVYVSADLSVADDEGVQHHNPAPLPASGPTSTQKQKGQPLEGWPFDAQINDLPESDVERAMGIENVEQRMARSPATPIED